MLQKTLVLACEGPTAAHRCLLLVSAVLAVAEVIIDVRGFKHHSALVTREAPLWEFHKLD
jgi:hypothetical protein